MTSPERGRNCYFQNRKVRKRKKHHPPSILHDKKSRTCYLCIMLHDNWSEHSTLQEHHVFSGPNRTNSEENGTLVIIEFDMAEYRRKNCSRAVKKTLSIPECLNEAAIRENINFSQILQEALMVKLGMNR